MRGLDEARTTTETLAVVRVIEEGVSNAYRHGGASQVHVEVMREAGYLRVQVSDDGSGIDHTSKPGLGSAVLESLAPSAWSLRRSDDGCTILEVQLEGVSPSP